MLSNAIHINGCSNQWCESFYGSEFWPSKQFFPTTDTVIICSLLWRWLSEPVSSAPGLVEGCDSGKNVQPGPLLPTRTGSSSYKGHHLPCSILCAVSACWAAGIQKRAQGKFERISYGPYLVDLRSCWDPMRKGNKEAGLWLPDESQSYHLAVWY